MGPNQKEIIIVHFILGNGNHFGDGSGSGVNASERFPLFGKYIKFFTSNAISKWLN